MPHVTQMLPDYATAGHAGTRKTLEATRRKYVWHACMERDVREHATARVKRQQTKPRCAKTAELLQPLLVPDRSWQSITTDFITGLRVSGDSSCDSICVAGDGLAKLAHFLPLHTTSSAEQFAELFIHRVWYLRCFGKSIVPDRDLEFVSAFWASFSAQLGIRRLLSTPTQPRTNGQTERSIRTLTQMLRR